MIWLDWTIERAREALIWSFIVAKMDTNRDGILDPSERRRMFDYLLQASIPGGEEATTDFIPIVRPHRETTADIIDPVLDHAGLNRPRETRYANSFASHGYAYLSNQRDSQYNYEDYDKWAGEGWAKFDYDAPDSTYCELKLSCFEVAQGSEATTDNIFKNFAFRRPECGNCLIAAGLRLSGKIGFEAFLPPSSSQYTVNHHDDVSHVLPITKTWQEADFSLREVVPKQADLRALCVRMLQRYPWVVVSCCLCRNRLVLISPLQQGDISTTFIKMNGPRETEFKLKSFISFEQEKVVSNDSF